MLSDRMVGGPRVVAQHVLEILPLALLKQRLDVLQRLEGTGGRTGRHDLDAARVDEGREHRLAAHLLEHRRHRGGGGGGAGGRFRAGDGPRGLRTGRRRTVGGRSAAATVVIRLRGWSTTSGPRTSSRLQRKSVNSL